jgi:hypothetical protein
VLLSRLVVVVRKDNVVLNRRGRGVEDQFRVIDSLLIRAGRLRHIEEARDRRQEIDVRNQGS